MHLRSSNQREQCDKSSEQSVGAKDFVFHSGGVCEELAVGRREKLSVVSFQLADIRGRISEFGWRILEDEKAGCVPKIAAGGDFRGAPELQRPQHVKGR
jgi:hypothetical protein